MIAGLSRAKIADGIRVLVENGLVTKSLSEKINVYGLVNYEIRSGWAKLPCKGLYNKERQSIRTF